MKVASHHRERCCVMQIILHAFDSGRQRALSSKKPKTHPLDINKYFVLQSRRRLSVESVFQK